MVQLEKSHIDQEPFWELPGGRIDPGEDLDTALKREVFEETGIQIDPGQPFGLWQWEMDPKIDDGFDQWQIAAIARHAKFLSGKLTMAHHEPGENIGRIDWIKNDQVNDLPIIHGLRPVLKNYMDQFIT